MAAQLPGPAGGGAAAMQATPAAEQPRRPGRSRRSGSSSVDGGCSSAGPNSSGSSRQQGQQAHPLRELGGVANQVVQHLHNAAGVAHHLLGRGGRRAGEGGAQGGAARRGLSGARGLCCTVPAHAPSKHRPAAAPRGIARRSAWRARRVSPGSRTWGVSGAIMLRMDTPGLASASAARGEPVQIGWGATPARHCAGVPAMHRLGSANKNKPSKQC